MLRSYESLLNSTSTVDKDEGDLFLKFIVSGEQEYAEKMIQKKPELLLYSGTVVDLSKRKFTQITGLQYAMWALDWHMWKMIMKYIPKEAAAEQAAGHKTGNWVSEHGQTAYTLVNNFIEAVEEYVDKAQKGYFAQPIDFGEFWVKRVGGAQAMLPIHFVNELCRTDIIAGRYNRSYVEETLPRTRQIRNGNWFKSDRGELGQFSNPDDSNESWSGFACVRGGDLEAYAATGAGPLRWYRRRYSDRTDWKLWTAEGIDCRTLKGIASKRREQLENLLNELKEVPKHKQNAPLKKK